MLNQFERSKEALGGIDANIDNWLHARRNLLVHYFKLVGLKPLPQRPAALPEASDVSEFCDVLLDYISTGHFEVYDQLIVETESLGKEALERAHSVYPQLRETTRVALDFNDRYETQQDDLEQLDNDLSKLGEALMDRFDLEDQMLSIVAEAKRPAESSLS